MGGRTCNGISRNDTLVVSIHYCNESIYKRKRGHKRRLWYKRRTLTKNVELGLLCSGLTLPCKLWRISMFGNKFYRMISLLHKRGKLTKNQQQFQNLQDQRRRILAHLCFAFAGGCRLTVPLHSLAYYSPPVTKTQHRRVEYRTTQFDEMIARGSQERTQMQ